LLLTTRQQPGVARQQDRELWKMCDGCGDRALAFRAMERSASNAQIVRYRQLRKDAVAFKDDCHAGSADGGGVSELNYVSVDGQLTARGHNAS